MQFEYSNFFKLSNFFSKKDSDILRKKQQHKLNSKQADIYLTVDSVGIFYEMVKNGYTPSSSQNKKFNQLIKKGINENNQTINDLVKNHDYLLTPEEMFYFLKEKIPSYQIKNIDSKISNQKIYTGLYLHNFIDVIEQINSTKNAEHQNYFVDKFLHLTKKANTENVFLSMILYSLINKEHKKQIPVEKFLKSIEISKDNLAISMYNLKQETCLYSWLRKKETITHNEEVVLNTQYFIETLKFDFKHIYEEKVENVINSAKIDYISEQATKEAITRNIES